MAARSGCARWSTPGCRWRPDAASPESLPQQSARRPGRPCAQRAQMRTALVWRAGNRLQNRPNDPLKRKSGPQGGPNAVPASPGRPRTQPQNPTAQVPLYVLWSAFLFSCRYAVQFAIARSMSRACCFLVPAASKLPADDHPGRSTRGIQTHGELEVRKHPRRRFYGLRSCPTQPGRFEFVSWRAPPEFVSEARFQSRRIRRWQCIGRPSSSSKL